MKQLIKKYSTPSSLGVFDQMVVSGGNFLIGILLARFLGLEAFGEFTLLWMIVFFALSLNMAFVSKPMLTLGTKKEEASTYFQALHTVQLVVACLAVLITYCGMRIAVKNDFIDYSSTIIMSVCMLVASQLVYDFYRKYFFVAEQILHALCLDILLFGIQVVAIVLFYWNGYASLENVLLLMGIIQLSILGITSLFVGVLSFNPTEIIKTTKEHMQYSGWLTLTAVLQWITGNYFLIIAGSVLGAAAVGIVKIVQQLSGLCHILFLAMENILPISAAKEMKKNGLNGLTQFLKKQGFLWFIPLLFFMSILLIGGPVFIKLLYEVELGENYFMLPGFAVLYLFVFLGIPGRIFFRTVERTKSIFIAYVLGAGFSLLAANSLLSNWGLTGLIVGLWIVQLITLLIYLLEHNKIIKSDHKSLQIV